MVRILYAEDERSLSEAIVDILVFKGYQVDVAYDGQEALDLAESYRYDLIILDIMMPKLDGIEVLKKLREEKITAPVLLLTARTEIEDRVGGLDSGADDYLGKPFDTRELLARIAALLRRRDNYVPSVVSFSDITLDKDQYKLTSTKSFLYLSKIEFQILSCFVENPGVCLSAEKILVDVWGYDTDQDTSIIWVYISNIRKKLKQTGSKLTIESRRNIGYQMIEPGKNN